MSLFSRTASLPDPGRPTIRRVVDNRVFLLGLDEFYRTAMKRHEREELLAAAQRVAHALNVRPAAVPVEGYYAEDERLTTYFRLMRALQQVGADRKPEVAQLPQFRRLYDVTSAPLYGRPQVQEKLLPTGRDPLSEALRRTYPGWTVGGLTAAAHEAAREFDDFSLVGLAARARDQVVIAALRESVVLYAECIVGCALPPREEFVWEVAPELAQAAGRFIEAFKVLFGDELPAPVPQHAQYYWHACDRNRIVGRCVRLGTNETQTHHYHWAICTGGNGELTVQDFWRDEIWTTTRYRASLGLGAEYLEQ